MHWWKKTLLFHHFLGVWCSLGRPLCSGMGWKRPFQMVSTSPLPSFSPWASFEPADSEYVQRITYFSVSLLISVPGHISKWSRCPQVFIDYDVAIAFHIIDHSFSTPFLRARSWISFGLVGCSCSVFWQISRLPDLWPQSPDLLLWKLVPGFLRTSSLPPLRAAFPFPDYAVYPCAVINHIRADDCVLSATSPPSESLSGIEFID